MNDSSDKQQNKTVNERSAVYLKTAEKQVASGDLESARESLEQCAELTRYRNRDVLKLLSKVYQLLSHKSYSANLWLQAANTALLDGDHDEACRAYVKTFDNELLEDEHWFRVSVYPFARNVLFELASKIASAEPPPNGSGTALLISSENHSVQYLRLLKSLLRSDKKAVTLVALFSEADEQYMDRLTRDAITNLVKSSPAILRPVGETSPLERIHFALAQISKVDSLISEQSLVAPEGLITAVAASLNNTQVYGCCFAGIPVFDGASKMFSNEQIANYSPVPAIPIVPSLKNEDPRYISAKNKTGSSSNITLWCSKTCNFSANWWITLKELIEETPEVHFVVSHPPGEEDAIPETLRAYSKNVYTLIVESHEAIPFAENIFLLLPEVKIPATVLVDCFGAGVPAFFLTDNKNRHDLLYPSFASEACIVFNESEQVAFTKAFVAHVKSKKEQQRFSLLASAKATRCSLKAVSEMLFASLPNGTAVTALDDSDSKTVENLSFKVETAVEPVTARAFVEPEEITAEPTKAKPEIIALYTKEYSPRISEYLNAISIGSSETTLAVVANRCSAPYPEGPHLFFPDDMQGNKYPGQTERALIDFLKTEHSTKHLLYIGLSAVERMAEFNSRVLRAKYSVLLLDSDTSIFPVEEHNLDSLQNFLQSAQHIYLSDLQATRWVEAIGINKEKTSAIKVSLPAKTREEATSDNLAVGIITATDKVADLASIQNSISSPHTFQLYTLGAVPDRSTLPATLDPGNLADVAHSELEDLDLVVIAAGDEAPIDATLPSLEFFIKQLSASGAAIITNCTKVVSTCEQIKSNSPITVFTSVKQLEKQVAALIADPAALRGLGERQRKSLLSENDIEKAGASEKKDGSNSLSDKIKALIANKNFAASNELLISALNNDPDNLGLLILRTETLLGLDQPGAARQTITKVLTSFPEHPRARELLQGIDATPTSLPPPEKDTNETGDPQNTAIMEPLEKSAAGHSELIDSVLGLLQNGDTVAAKALLETHRPDIIPQDYYYTLALCYAKEGDYENSRQAVLEELRNFPENTAARDLSKSLDEFLR